MLVYGVNSSNQSISIQIKWRPNETSVYANRDKVNASVRLRFDDNDGNYYTLEEESDVEYRHREYRVGGLGLEIMSPFRRKRIKFRGYLKKNEKELVYVRIRFLWIGMSRVYDFTTDFDDYFMAKEFTLSPETQNEQQFEDRFSQFGQMKGTFKVEKQPERVLYFWGSLSKKYLTNQMRDQFSRRIIRLFGYTNKGLISFFYKTIQILIIKKYL